MHIHILGICGTFMGGVAALAKAAGHQVSGSDANAYPPMSTQLRQLGIEIMDGYLPAHLSPAPDVVVVGNVMSRGNPAVEAMLNMSLRYQSGPEWLAEHVLDRRQVLAVAGTHGKTTTASMLAWILESAGLSPGFLIGGVPANFGETARFGSGKPFVVEADEYDTAFFDKRAKFVHYRPSVLILNNLEFDHADIYPDLDAIRWQFHQLLRTVPGEGRLVVNATDDNLRALLEQGCWTPVETFALDDDADWQGRFRDVSEREITIGRAHAGSVEVRWQLGGAHNLENALAAVAAACAIGVRFEQAVDALAKFTGVKRRMERTATVAGIGIYDDFAHHPTAIRRTLESMRRQHPGGRIVVALEPRSNTMRLGVHNDSLAVALQAADEIWLYRSPEDAVGLDAALEPLGERLRHFDDYDQLVNDMSRSLKRDDRVVFMSNGSFGGARQTLTAVLQRTRSKDFTD